MLQKVVVYLSSFIKLKLCLEERPEIQKNETEFKKIKIEITASSSFLL